MRSLRVAALRAEETLVGLISLAAAGWIVWILMRGVRDRRLPIGKGEVWRDERAAAFHSLFAVYVAAAFGMAFIGLDLLLGLTGRN